MVISDGNIFNTTRHGRRSAGSGEDSPRVDTITLYGTFMYEKGFFAFFTGSSAEFSKVLDTGKSIAGYTITEILGSGVKLTAGTNTFALRVGMQLRREEGREWEIAGGSASSGGSVSPTSSSSFAAANDSSRTSDSDVANKMMKQREQELK